MAFSGRHEPNLRTTHAAVHIYVGDDLMSRVFLGPGGDSDGHGGRGGMGVGGGGVGGGGGMGKCSVSDGFAAKSQGNILL